MTLIYTLDGTASQAIPGLGQLKFATDLGKAWLSSRITIRCLGRFFDHFPANDIIGRISISDGHER